MLLERLSARGLPKAEAEMRLSRQATEEEFRAAADVVILNDGDRDATRARVREAWERLRSAPRG
jgi:dephospho-CoA kinase